MSEAKLWSIDIAIPTTCSATFMQTEANIGDRIDADFAWANARLHPLPEMWYAYMRISSPTGVIKAYYMAVGDSEGIWTLDCIVDEIGTWTCYIQAWNGIVWIEDTDDLLAWGVIAILMPTSVYHTIDPATGQPFIPKTVALVCSLDIQNAGNLTGKLMWQIYSFTPGEFLEDEGISVEDWPRDGIWTKPIEITIPEYPDQTEIQLGVKVKGPLEIWPDWPGGLASGQAKIIRLGLEDMVSGIV